MKMQYENKNEENKKSTSCNSLWYSGLEWIVDSWIKSFCSYMLQSDPDDLLIPHLKWTEKFQKYLQCQSMADFYQSSLQRMTTTDSACFILDKRLLLASILLNFHGKRKNIGKMFKHLLLLEKVFPVAMNKFGSQLFWAICVKKYVMTHILDAKLKDAELVLEKYKHKISKENIKKLQTLIKICNEDEKKIQLIQDSQYYGKHDHTHAIISIIQEIHTSLPTPEFTNYTKKYIVTNDVEIDQIDNSLPEKLNDWKPTNSRLVISGKNICDWMKEHIGESQCKKVAHAEKNTPKQTRNAEHCKQKKSLNLEESERVDDSLASEPEENTPVPKLNSLFCDNFENKDDDDDIWKGNSSTNSTILQSNRQSPIKHSPTQRLLLTKHKSPIHRRLPTQHRSVNKRKNTTKSCSDQNSSLSSEEEIKSPPAPKRSIKESVKKQTRHLLNTSPEMITSMTPTLSEASSCQTPVMQNKALKQRKLRTMKTLNKSPNKKLSGANLNFRIRAERQRELQNNPVVKFRKHQWTYDEIKKLKEGLKLYGPGRWNEILLFGHEVFRGRTNVMIKDKYRWLKKKDMV